MLELLRLIKALKNIGTYFSFTIPPIPPKEKVSQRLIHGELD